MSDGDGGTLGDASDGSTGKYVENMFLAFGWRMKLVTKCQRWTSAWSPYAKRRWHEVGGKMVYVKVGT